SSDTLSSFVVNNKTGRSDANLMSAVLSMLFFNSLTSLTTFLLKASKPRSPWSFPNSSQNSCHHRHLLTSSCQNGLQTVILCSPTPQPPIKNACPKASDTHV